MVIATITIEGENLSRGFISMVLSKIKKYFTYKFRFKNSNAEIVYFELTDNFIEIQQ